MTKFVPRSAAALAGSANTRSILNRALSMALPAALLLAAGATAQTTSTRGIAESANNRMAHGERTTQGLNVNPLHNLSASSPAEAQYRVLDSLLNAFSYFSNGQEPLQYDAASNTLVTIMRGAPGKSDQLFVRMSTDMGQTWSEPHGPLNASVSGLARYPSIKIINKNNSANRADLLYYFTYPVTTGESFGSYFQGFLDGSFTPLSAPEGNSGVTVDGELQPWSSDSRSVVSADGNVVISAGSMENNHLGIRRYDLNSGLLTAYIPPQWNATNFVDPEDANSRTAVIVGMDRDAAGTMYAGIYSRFPDLETDGRRAQPYPAVATSSDNGTTWSNWDILPPSLLMQYAESQGANPDSTIIGYSGHDFVVTGNGNFSFVANLFEVNDDLGEGEAVTQLVEVYKNNGQWGIRKVADASGLVLAYLPVDGDESSNQLGNEPQISRTADGSGLIVKWVDFVNYNYEEDINGDGVDGDTLTTTDVFVAGRKLDGTSWSGMKNVTETPIADRVTWIPNIIVNNYANIPLLTVQAAVTDEQVTLADQLVLSQRELAATTQYINLTNFDASSVASVSQGGSVTASSGMTLNPAYPNPATAEAAIGFSLKNAGQATLDVWNVMGERVANLFSGNAEAGEHTAKIQVAALPAGTYYYTLKSGGETLTRMFTVVR